MCDGRQCKTKEKAPWGLFLYLFSFVECVNLYAFGLIPDIFLKNLVK